MDLRPVHVRHDKTQFYPFSGNPELRDLIRYRVKLTNMLTGEKNRAQNCLTISNLKLDDVFSDVFGKSARSITNYILEHPGETFDVSPFVDPRDRKSTRLNSSHVSISYAVFCLKKKT